MDLETSRIDRGRVVVAEFELRGRPIGGTGPADKDARGRARPYGFQPFRILAGGDAGNTRLICSRQMGVVHTIGECRSQISNLHSAILTGRAIPAALSGASGLPGTVLSETASKSNCRAGDVVEQFRDRHAFQYELLEFTDSYLDSDKTLLQHDTRSRVQ